MKPLGRCHVRHIVDVFRRSPVALHLDCKRGQLGQFPSLLSGFRVFGLRRKRQLDAEGNSAYEGTATENLKSKIYYRLPKVGT